MKDNDMTSGLPPHFRLKTGFRFGLITSLISSSIGIALYSAGITDINNSSGGWISVLLVGLGIYLASEFYKKHNQGFMGQKDLMVVSGWLGLFSGIVSAIIFMVQFQLDSSILSKMQNNLEFELEKQGLEGADFDRAMEMGSLFFNPYLLGSAALISSVIMAFVVGFILSFFLKKEASDPFS
jgi:hypothetical protein